jgi:hypothetical protein
MTFMNGTGDHAGKTIVLFEDVRWLHVPLLWLGRLLGWEMHILQKAGPPRIVARFLRLGWLRWVYVYNPRPLTSLAVRLAEQRFGGKQGGMDRLLRALALPEDIECIRLRQAVEGVFASSFLHYRACLFARPDAVRRVLVVTTDSDLWPHVAYSDFGLPAAVTGKVRNVGSLGLVRFEKWARTFLFALRFAMSNGLRVLATRIGSRRVPAAAPRHFKCALKFNHPWHLKFKGARRHDFLVDGKTVRHEDITYFLSFTPSAAETAQIGSANITLLRDQLRLDNFLGRRWDWRDVGGLLAILAAAPFMRDGARFFPGVQALFSGHLLMRSLKDKVAFDNFIYCNDESLERVGGNAVLRRSGVRTWCYPVAIGGPYLYDVEDSHWDTINPIWCYLNPDVWLAYNEAMSKSFARQHQRVGDYMVIGNMFGALTGQTKKGEIHRRIAEMAASTDAAKQGMDFSRRTVIVFDTSYIDSNDTYSPITTGINFLGALMEIAKAYPDINFIFKPSKTPLRYKSENNPMFATDNTRAYGRLCDQASSLKNWYSLSDEIDPPDLISIADLVVTAPFSSPTGDAISCGVPAIWFEPEARPRKYLFERLPGFVAMGKAELANGFETWSDTGAIPEAWKPHPKDIRAVIDPFLDQGALGRLRKVLTGEGAARVKCSIGAEEG